MKDYIIWKGVNSRTAGITVMDLPEIILPEERVTFTDVPGFADRSRRQRVWTCIRILR